LRIIINSYIVKRTIIWDWNGTLLNDRAICLKGINIMLGNRKLPLLTDERYLGIFTFPIREYYSAAGFDFVNEPFEVPAAEFMDHYTALLGEAKLFPDSNTALAHFKNRGFRQFILSAMEQQMLHKSINSYNLAGYLEGVYGIADILAHSKLDRGREMVQMCGIDTTTALFVGDTLHDIEVAEQLGASPVLIGRGHQSLQRLMVNGNIVLPDFAALMNLATS